MTFELNKKQRGVGLIELMVSITIGLFVLAGVMQLYLTSSQNVSSFEGSSRIQENARYAFTRFEQDIGMAGNMGCFSKSVIGSAEGSSSRIINVLGEDSGAGGVFSFDYFISGENDNQPGAAGANSSDRLILRYASAGQRYPVVQINDAAQTLEVQAGVVGSISDNQVLMLGDCSNTVIFSASDIDTTNNRIEYAVGTADGNGTQFNANLPEPPLTEIFTAVSDVNDLKSDEQRVFLFAGKSGAFDYKIGTSAAGTAAGSSCDAATPEYCALFRSGDEIVEGVEDLDFEYGWLEGSPPALKFVNAAQVDAQADPVNAWKSIDRVRVTATFNSINNAVTNEGAGLIKRTYSRVFVVPNQLPLAMDLENAL